MKNKLEIFNKAKKDFQGLVDNSTEKEKKEFLNGYGIWALKFAHRYVNGRDRDIYKKIYNIVWEWCEKYEKTIKDSN